MQHLTSEILIDYLHHELSPAEDARVLAHIEHCDVCTRELNVEASITDRLRTIARAEELELPLGLRSAIMARIASQNVRPATLLRRWLAPALLVPVAAAAAAAAFFLSPGPQTTQAAALPVSYYLEQHAVQAQANPLGDRGAIMLTSFNSTNDGGQSAR
ncbi:MAG: zf-HC2 domain-containing protein [Candidatus Eremiobacteraeota bacterium]|nr:zf-HC2 domain-containing protein [Candidatus Eremiobacteraeota bacterium]MBV8424026.1 zf-HC2 domain-containing protein [Candidatus Eremiobacteraeota bacterium]